MASAEKMLLSSHLTITFHWKTTLNSLIIGTAVANNIIPILNEK